MIYFNQLTEHQSEILSNGKVIGKLDRLANTYYLIEIEYHDFVLPIKDKRLVKGVIEKVYSRFKAREIRERKPMRKHSEFKIKE